MGTGRSGLSKGIRNTHKSEAANKAGLRVKAKSAGYDLIMSDNQAKEYESYIDRYLDELTRYQQAMRETDDILQAAGGNLSIVKMPYDTGGDASASGNIRLNESRIKNLGDFEMSILPHEHTHNLVHTLITKELGYKKDTPEFYLAYTDAIIEHSINVEALNKYKNYMRREYDRQIREINAEFAKHDEKYHAMLQFGIDRIKRDRAELDTITIERASKLSNMRDYATRQYNWAPAGHYIEMPTVAAEKFRSSGYSFKHLLQTSPYSYFVMQTLYHRLHKGKNKK